MCGYYGAKPLLPPPPHRIASCQQNEINTIYDLTSSQLQHIQCRWTCFMCGFRQVSGARGKTATYLIPSFLAFLTSLRRNAWHRTVFANQQTNKLRCICRRKAQRRRKSIHKNPQFIKVCIYTLKVNVTWVLALNWFPPIAYPGTNLNLSK